MMGYLEKIFHATIWSWFYIDSQARETPDISNMYWSIG